MPRFIRITALLVALTLVAVGLTAAPALASPESQMVTKINATRAANGLPPLEVYWDLADDAEAHSQRMMNRNDLHHNPNLANVTSGWHALGENVGVGPSVNSLHKAFMDSSGHRKNILGNYNYVGVGVKRESDLKIWVTVVFMRGPDGIVDPPPSDPPPADPPPSDPPPSDPPPSDPPPSDPPPSDPPPADPPPSEDQPERRRVPASAPDPTPAQAAVSPSAPSGAAVASLWRLTMWTLDRAWFLPTLQPPSAEPDLRVTSGSYPV